MKVKRCTTDKKKRNLRDAGAAQTRGDLRRNTNTSEQMFRRRKQNFGVAEMPAAPRLKVLAKRNRALKEMLTDSLLKKRVLKIVNAKQQ